MKIQGTHTFDAPRERVWRALLDPDRHVIVEKGRVVWRGSSSELDADRALWHRYLGA